MRAISVLDYGAAVARIHRHIEEQRMMNQISEPEAKLLKEDLRVLVNWRDGYGENGL